MVLRLNEFGLILVASVLEGIPVVSRHYLRYHLNDLTFLWEDGAPFPINPRAPSKSVYLLFFVIKARSTVKLYQAYDYYFICPASCDRPYLVTVFESGQSPYNDNGRK